MSNVTGRTERPVPPEIPDVPTPMETPGLRYGVPAGRLTDAQLLRELHQLHRTRHDTFLYGSAGALDRHSMRTHELEQEYLRRHPKRHVAAGRTRRGARARAELL